MANPPRSLWDKALDLEPAVAERAYYLVWWLYQVGGVVRVSEGLRSAERQRWLYASGRTRPGPILTNTLNSRHLSGRAFDVDFQNVAADAVHPLWWDYVGRVGEYLGLTWGGRWRLRDYRHFEI